MDDEHLSCPQCAYDLHGIPEIRCPECGFRFDRAALKDLAVSADWLRWAVAQDVTVRALWSVALTLMPATINLGLSGLGGFVLGVTGFTVAFVVCVRIGHNSIGSWSIPALIPLYCASLLLWALLQVAFPQLVNYTAMVPLAAALWMRLGHWPALAPEPNVADAILRCSTERHSHAADGTVVLALTCGLLALVG